MVVFFVLVNMINCLNATCQWLDASLVLQDAEGQRGVMSVQVFGAIVVQLKMALPRAQQVQNQARSPQHGSSESARRMQQIR